VIQVWRLYFEPFWFYREDRQTESRTESITEAYDRYTHATTVGVSNKSTPTKKINSLSGVSMSMLSSVVTLLAYVTVMGKVGGRQKKQKGRIFNLLL